MALISISKSNDGSTKNSILRDYYLLKCKSKPKMVSPRAVMLKASNIVFTILCDEKAFEIITPEEHQKNYRKAECGFAA